MHSTCLLFVIKMTQAEGIKMSKIPKLFIVRPILGVI